MTDSILALLLGHMGRIALSQISCFLDSLFLPFCTVLCDGHTAAVIKPMLFYFAIFKHLTYQHNRLFHRNCDDGTIQQTHTYI